jgi:uncharacterized protein (TIGR01732 family)
MYGYSYGAPTTGCFAPPVAPVAPVAGFGRGFALIVVLFILLVIIGASWVTPAV